MAKTSRRERWHPPAYDKQDVRAVHAIAAYAGGGGEPPTQQDCARALDWIVNTACATYDEPFRPNEPDANNYMLGRRSVGLAIVKLMKLKPELFDE